MIMINGFAFVRITDGLFLTLGVECLVFNYLFLGDEHYYLRERDWFAEDI